MTPDAEPMPRGGPVGSAASAPEMRLQLADEAILARLRAPSAVRYIKLGRNGAWAPRAFAEDILPFGYREIPHAPCAAGAWDEVRTALRDGGRSPAGESQGVRELKAFYGLDDRCVWATFADGHLWWAFAEEAVQPLPDDGHDGPRRYRRVIGGWRRASMTGEPLTTRSLSSALTRTAGFRMTLCTFEREAYLLRRLCGDRDPLQIAAEAVQDAARKLAGEMIAQLDWRDFEMLIDLIFARGGWRRGSALGRGEVDDDLILSSPVTGETAWVQIKSQADQKALDDYLTRFRRDGSCDRFFFVCHSPHGILTLPEDPALHLWAGPALADAAVRSGLVEWLSERMT